VGSIPTLPTKGYNSKMSLLILTPWVLTFVIGLATLVLVRKGESDNTDYIDDNNFIEAYNPTETIRVAIYDERAYWVYDNTFYESEVSKEPDFDTARPIDIESLSSEEMKHLFSVLDDIKSSFERE
jgi:hypothetical protein